MSRCINCGQHEAGEDLYCPGCADWFQYKAEEDAEEFGQERTMDKFDEMAEAIGVYVFSVKNFSYIPLSIVAALAADLRRIEGEEKQPQPDAEAGKEPVRPTYSATIQVVRAILRDEDTPDSPPEMPLVRVLEKHIGRYRPPCPRCRETEAAVKAAVLAERAACATVAATSWTADAAAVNIRARGGAQ